MIIPLLVFFFKRSRFRGGRNTAHPFQKRRFCVYVHLVNACQWRVSSKQLLTHSVAKCLINYSWRFLNKCPAVGELGYKGEVSGLFIVLLSFLWIHPYLQDCFHRYPWKLLSFLSTCFCIGYESFFWWCVGISCVMQGHVHEKNSIDLRHVSLWSWLRGQCLLWSLQGSSEAD